MPQEMMTNPHLKILTLLFITIYCYYQTKPNHSFLSLFIAFSLSLSDSVSLSHLPVMAVQLWETLKEAIVVYTGLSPSTFFTVLTLLLAVYYVVSGLFGAPPNRPRPRHIEEEEMPPLKPPVQLGEVTAEELKAYDGKDPDKPLLMAIKGQIYDVSQSRLPSHKTHPFLNLLFSVILFHFDGLCLFWVFYLFCVKH